MVGTVNASRADFVSGVNDMVKAEAALSQLAPEAADHKDFRPLITDSVVLNICNHRLLSTQDFHEELGVVHLKPDARKKFYAKFEERLQEEIQHPQFGYRTSYQRCIELQTRLLSKWLTGEIAAYPPMNVR